MVSPDISQLLTQLAEVSARNAAGAVASKISAVRARKLDQEAMNELIELVNDLIADKNELINIANALEAEIVAQRISEDDIAFITTTLLPVIEELTSAANNASESREMLDAIRKLVTPEMLTIMQLLDSTFDARLVSH